MIDCYVDICRRLLRLLIIALNNKYVFLTQNALFRHHNLITIEFSLHKSIEQKTYNCQQEYTDSKKKTDNICFYKCHCFLTRKCNNLVIWQRYVSVLFLHYCCQLALWLPADIGFYNTLFLTVHVKPCQIRQWLNTGTGKRLKHAHDFLRGCLNSIEMQLYIIKWFWQQNNNGSCTNENIRGNTTSRRYLFWYQ